MNSAPRLQLRLFPGRHFSDLPIYALALFFVSLAAFYPPSVRAETELLPNDKFSDDAASWKLSNDQKISGNMFVEKVDGEPALCVAIDLGGAAENPGQLFMARIQRLFGEISKDKNYRISFKAKAEKDAEIVAYVSPEKDGSRVLWRNQIQVGADWKDYTFTFAGRDSVPDCAFGFARLGGTTNKYWFRDIVLTED